MEIEIVDATEEHARGLAPNLRAADALEVKVSSGLTPENALLASVKLSTHSWTALLDGKPEIMWGVAPYSYTDSRLNQGVVWLLSSDEMYKIPGRFVKESHIYVAKMLETFDTLFNYVHAENIASCKWLENLGFKAVDRKEDYGVGQQPFILYVRNN